MHHNATVTDVARRYKTSRLFLIQSVILVRDEQEEDSGDPSNNLLKGVKSQLAP